ncbi:cation:H+ antiporter [Tangfeifania diversioriginum]|uniref:Cation:H+ antiporter n=1 Tax=Tangfeifania diversioriginum TaxID=1168035 RepID=A0A1M6FW30_9BACT|nr:calcium/sodium antiporter [Tangfeifania diversioriginum]SHJ01809.1 cation:H+ antiporter [Tangfeifania diversioriginum]
MLVNSLLLILGLAVLIKGADWLVSGASALAKKYHVSDLVIGLTIVAFGTSAPELVVNVIASSQNFNDIVLGNVLGSNIANLFLILGITGIIYPLVVQSSTTWKEIPLSLLAVVILFLLANNFFILDNPVISRLDGLFLFLMFGLFMFYVYRLTKTDKAPVEVEVNAMSSFKMITLIVIGLAGLILGGRLVVNNAVEIATILGLSEKIIGFTIVAIGTSLPELATSVVAALKKNTNIAVGNIIGSNIFNIFLVIATSAVVSPVTFNPVFNIDIYLLAGGTLFLFIAMFTGGKKKLDRWEATILLLIYLGYTAMLVAKEI